MVVTVKLFPEAILKLDNSGGVENCYSRLVIKIVSLHSLAINIWPILSPQVCYCGTHGLI